MVLPETLIDPQDIESEDNMADMSNRTFHCFASLPPELRINIWRHSFPEPRDLLADLMGIRANQWVHLLSTTGVVDEVICKGRYKPAPNPAIAKVCRESRTILFESYTLRLALRKSSIARGRPTCSMCLYLDPTRDTMEFRDASDTFTMIFPPTFPNYQLTQIVLDNPDAVAYFRWSCPRQLREFVDKHVTFTIQHAEGNRERPKFSGK